MRPAIFLDAAVIKAAVDTQLVLLPESKKIPWGGQEIEVDVHRPVYINQNLYFLQQGKRDRFEDTVALRLIAKDGKIELQVHDEVIDELMGLPDAMGHGPLFHGAPITRVAGPIPYGRTVVDGSPRRWSLRRERRLPPRDWQKECEAARVAQDAARLAQCERMISVLTEIAARQ